MGVGGIAFSLLVPFLKENLDFQEEDWGWSLYMDPRVEVDHFERNLRVAEDAAEMEELLRRREDRGRS